MKNKLSLLFIIIALTSRHCCFAQNSLIDSLHRVLLTEKEDTGKVKTMNALCQELNQIGNYDSAIIYANGALALSEKLILNTKKGSELWRVTMKGQATSYGLIGSIYQNQGNSGEALENQLTALKIREEIEDKKGMANSYNNIGINYINQGNYSEALKNLLASIKLNGEIGNKKGMASAYNNIGIVYDRQGNYSEALKYYFDALKINEEIGNKAWEPYNLNGIGTIYLEMGNYPEALKNYLTALKIYQEFGNQRGIADSYNFVGMVYHYQKNYSEALKNYSASLKIRQDIGDQDGIAVSFMNIGVIYYDQGNYAEALKNNLASLNIKKEIGDQQGIIESYNNLGQTFTTMKKFVEARKYFEDALILSKEIGNTQGVADSYSGLAQMDSAQGNYQPALEHYKLYITYRDSLFNDENTKKITQQQMKYTFDKQQDSTKAVQNKKDAVANAELQSQKVQKYSFIIGAILLLVLALVLYNRYRLKQKSNREITKAYEHLKQTQTQLVQSEKMASIGQLTAGIAHEINNPINFVSANIAPLRRDVGEIMKLLEQYASLDNSNFSQKLEGILKYRDQIDINYTIEEIKSLLSGIEEGSARTASIVKGLRNFSRLDEDGMKKENINEGIESTLVLLSNRMDEKNISVEESLGKLPEIECNAGQLNQVFMSVISNAIDAIGKDGKIFINTSHQDNRIKISIRDTGSGMSEAVRKKIFDPFFTTKDVGKGTGLGLSISYGIIEKHNGTIEVNSEPGKGTEFVILLPV